ncbi:histidine phosphatase family protein [Mariniplasma anaerobium]|uniref:Phosphoglycerate mutase n=1 Tax=Mariniplasma anaerobium TaxID=2735436 RepID=A0A7U9XX80_9MOLU|nr:histidine phosphatase family protein [Mariniplasma anaerobium]BCR35951.1 phosphoglycerate mutase [Mariniplasma anaerobium]
MILAMVRHGQTNSNINQIIQGRTDNPLNEDGKLEAHKLADILKSQNKKFDAFISSPLSRALETAFILSKKLDYNKPIHVIQQFVERNFFHLEGIPVEEGMPLVRQKGYKYPGYEDDDKIINRVVKATLKLENIYKDQEVLCVAHSHVIKSLLVYINPIKYQFSTYLVNNCDVLYFKLENQKLTLIDHQKND